MEIRELNLFRHLASTLHFGRTSRACNVTPSALTRTVQRLEEELGQKLFLRDKRTVALTAAGEMFKKYAEEVTGRWQELQNSLAGDEVLRGEIRLYCSVTAVYSLLPAMLGRFRGRWPAVRINLRTGDAAQALTTLQNGEVDVAIAALPESLPPGVECLPVLETPLLFIAPKLFPETVVYQGGEIDWLRTPLILAERGLSRARVEQWLRQRQVRANVYAQVAGNEAIIAMVSQGCGIGVVPKLVLEISPLREQIEILPLAPPLAPFSVGVCAAKKNMAQPIVQAFWAIAGQAPSSSAG